MKVKKKILSLLLAIAMILGMLPMTALPVYAADATQIKIWNGTEMQTYTLGIDTLPNGLFWNSTDNRLELDGYNGGRIEQATSGDELTFYVLNDSTIDGGEETALRYSNPTIDGVAGKTLTLTGIKNNVMYITGSCTIKNITVKVDQKGTVKPNGYTTATSGNIKVRENGRLEVELNKETDNPYSAQAVGNLSLYDNGSANITVTANNTKTTDAYGVYNLYLYGTGDCDITVTNNGSGNTWAVQYEPNIYSSYNVTGAWNSQSVSYKAANPDTNADLSALTCDLGAVSPTFKSNVTSYTGPNYSYNYNTAGITATVAETGASLKINGEAATSGVLKYVPIAVGENVIPVVVTSKDSSTTKTYTLTITRESGGSYNLTVVNGSKDPDTDTVEAGDTVTITANTPDTGKVFDKWTSEDGVTFADASSATTTFVMPAEAVTVTATYKNDPDMDTELRNIEVNITTPSTSWESPALTPVYDKATRTYTLNVSTEYNTIYFYLQEMLSGQSVSATVDGVSLTVDTALNGFQTVQHTLTKATTVFVFTVTAKDGTTKDTYTVTVNRGSGTTYALTVINGTTTTPTPAEGDTVTITANTPATGKIFDKWTSEDGVTFANASSSTTTFTMPAKAVTVTATYKNDPDMDTELRNIEVNITTPSTSWESPALTPVYDKATRTYTLNVSTEYNTIYFYLQEMLSGQSVSATVDGAPLTVNTVLNGFETVQHTLTKAKTVFVFTVTAKDGTTKDTYTVTVNWGSGTTYALTVINGTTTTPTPAEGDTVTITANPPATGKVFDKWTTTDGVVFANANSATTTFVMPAEAVTVTATYKDAPVTTYSVTVQNDGNGTGSASPASAEAGTEITLTATPNAGKQFKEWQVVSGSVTISGNKFTMPASDVTIKAIFEDIKVTGVNLDQSTLSLTAGGATKTLKATVTPVNAANRNVTWSTSNETVATVVNGVVTPLSAGTATITVTTVDGSKTATCTVTVTAAPVTVTGISIKTAPSKVSYTAGEALDLSGMEVTLAKSDTTTEDVAFADFGTKGITASPANGTTLAATDTTVTLTHTASGKTTGQTITVNPAPVTVTGISIKTAPGKVSYTAGEALDLSGMEVTLAKSDTTTEDVAFADFGAKGITATPANGTTLATTDTTVTLTHTASGKTATQSITVNPAPDTTPPVIYGVMDRNVVKDTTVDVLSGVTATDDVDGAVTVTASPSTIDTSTLGTTTVTYTATDTAGNTATTTATFTVVESAVPVTGVTLDKATLDLTAGGATGTLVATVAPANATNKNVTWSSSDTSIATVVNGAVTPLSTGTATITVKTEDGNFEATCTVTVAAVTYAVTLETDGNGTASASPTSAEAGTEITLSASPNGGYVFKEWQVVSGGVTISGNKFTMPAGDVTVKAVFEAATAPTYAVTVNSGTGSGNFAAGTTVTITAGTPADGKEFDKWTTTDGVEFENVNNTTTTFVMPAKAVTVTATYKDISSETPDYKIIAGENSIWNKGNTKGIVIISKGDYGDFTGVNVDGIFIDSSNYTSAAGSTVVTLKPAYLETLAVGTHIVTLQFGNYSVQTNLTILAADERPDESKPDESKPDESKPDESKPNEEIPKTGDSNHTLPLIGLLLLSGSALIGVTRNKKKKKSYNK